MFILKHNLIFILFILTIISCSSDNTEEEIIIKTCIIVKELETGNPIANIRVFLNGEIECDYLGCGRGAYIYGSTDSNGEVCLSLIESEYKLVVNISAYKEGYPHYETDFPLDEGNTIFIPSF